MNFDNKYMIGGGLFLGYAGCSLLFLKKPQFLWTKYISDNYSMK